jgi:LCP family protein required for cell wall assembly
MSQVRWQPPGGREGFRFLGRAGLAVVLVVVLTASATATFALLKVDTYVSASSAGPSIKTLTPVAEAPPGGAQTILVLGSDRRWADLKSNNPLLREDNPARSDTMLLVRMDPDRDVTSVLSMPRDLKVTIPGAGLDKLNASYSVGGPDLTRRTIEDLLPGVEINHIVNVNFAGFRQAVSAIGCVYADVDRRYYHSNLGLPVSAHYAEIDVDPGYQRLCGQRALDYVRHRHGDNDIVRSARQQDFLRSAKDQLSTSQLVGNLDELLKILRKNTQTDKRLSTVKGALRLGKLALYSSDKPVVQVEFPAQFTGSFVEASPAALKKVADKFLDAEPPVKRDKPTRKATNTQKSIISKAKLVDGTAAARTAAKPAVDAGDVGFPLYYPKLITPQGRYVAPDTDGRVRPRTYSLRDRAGRKHLAYRLVIQQSQIEGQYYGVQGTTWSQPPLLAHPDATARLKGRTLKLFKSGSRLRFVSWRKGRAVYWVSNTLSLRLSNGQMLGIAASLARMR